MQKKTVSQSKGGLDLTQEFDIVSKFLGYTNRQEPTNLPPGYLVSGSQNVMLDVTGNVKSRPGYTLDGQANLTASGIITAFDWEEHTGNTINLRQWGQNLEFRYVDGNGNVTWQGLPTTMNVNLQPARFTNYWDNGQLKNVLLWVDGFTGNFLVPVYQWNGAVTTLASYNVVPGSTIDLTGSINESSLTIGGSANFSLVSPTGIGVTFTGGLLCNANPTNGQTLTLIINSQTVTVNFVSTIGAAAGNVLIGGSVAATLTNLLGLLQNPSVTSSTQVAFAAGDQTKINYLYYQPAGTYNIINNGSSWEVLGFYVAGVGIGGSDRRVVINGNTYRYAGYGGNKMFGLTSNPSGEAAGSLIIQNVVSIQPTGIPTTYTIDLIGNLNNQIIYGSLSSTQVYISKVDNFSDVGHSSPTLIGEGGTLSLKSSPTAFVVQENTMYISGKNSFWYQLTETIDSTNVYEIYAATPLKSGALQAAQSQESITKDKNDIVFLTFEPVLSTLGRVVNQLATPMTQDLSWMIVNDINKYNLIGAYLKYFKNFIYIALPAEGKVLIYNQTNPQNSFWEAPQILPFSCFSIINGAIYGHDSTYPQSYKMFSGLQDTRNPNFIALSQSAENWWGMCSAPNGNVYSCYDAGGSTADIYMQTAGAGNFVALNQSYQPWRALTATFNGNVYACTYGGDIYMQTGGVGNFVALSQGNQNWIAMTTDVKGNVYAAVDGGGIFMQTGGVGNFVSLSQASRAWRGMCASYNGNVYASVVSGDIYMQTNGVGTFTALSQTNRAWRGMAADNAGNIYCTVQGGDIYMQTNGTGNFVGLGQSSLAWWGITTSADGSLYANVHAAGDIYKRSMSVSAIATFSYMNMGLRELKKWFTEFYIEGHIIRPTILTEKIAYETDGNALIVPFTTYGTDSIVANYPSTTSLVKFRVIKTTPRVDFYEVQPSFSSIGTGEQWEIIAFGFLATLSEQLNNAIKQ